MEPLSQNLPSVLASEQVNPTDIAAQAATTPNPIVGAAQAAATPEVVVAAGANSIHPPLRKKRKANVNGPRRTSYAWDHFNKLPDEKEAIAACKHCHKRYACDTKLHGTSNLLNHLKLCPKYAYSLITDSKQKTLTFTSEGTSLVSASTRFNVEACRKALAVFVILDEHPFRTVEGEGFKFLCRQLQPQFTPPSRRTVARDCFQLYLDEKKRLKSFFKSDCPRVALTTDCWTSVQNLNYLTLTAHFVDNEWKYQKRIISFAVVPNHRGETVGKKVEEVCKEWGLRNFSTITVDNASSNDVAVAYLKKKFKNMNGLMLDGEFFHVRCCAHILNLVVNDGLKDNQPSISNIRNAVRFVRSSPHRAAKFKEYIEFSAIESKKLLCLDVPTRWNSTYLMLDAAEKFQAAFEKLEDEDTHFRDFFGVDGPPTVVDWANVRDFVRFLKLFFDATKIFSTSQEVSLHTAFHQLSLLYCEMKAKDGNLNTIMATMGTEMLKKYNKYWGKVENINQLLYFGVILDPRYKLRVITWSFDQMYGVDSELGTELFQSINNNLSRLYNSYKQVYEAKNRTGQSAAPSPTVEISESETSSITQISPSQARADAFMQHLSEKDSIDKKNELERYLSEHNIQPSGKFDILEWWKLNSSRYPILSTLVRDIMATPVSTVASESAFSTGGRIVDSFRSCLKPEMAEALICSQNWLRPSIFQFKDLQLDEEFEVSAETIKDFEVRNEAAGSGVGGPDGSIGERDVGAGATGVAAANMPSSQSQPVCCD